jgi:hypothetical protein
MAKLSKAKEYAILYLNDTLGASSQSIAEELDIAVSTVNDILDGRTPVESIGETKSKKKTTKAHDMMIRHTSSKKNNNVSIMTKEANEYQQELIRNLGSQARDNSSIFRMR